MHQGQGGEACLCKTASMLIDWTWRTRDFLTAMTGTCLIMYTNSAAVFIDPLMANASSLPERSTAKGPILSRG
jgi:hypothetical protein